jgi:hypothetical protein
MFQFALVYQPTDLWLAFYITMTYVTVLLPIGKLILVFIKVYRLYFFLLGFPSLVNLFFL